MCAGRRSKIASLFFALWLLLSKPTSAQVNKSAPAAADTKSTVQKPSGTAARLSAIVASGRLEDLRWPDFSGYRTHVVNFYRPFGYKAAWLRNGAPTRQAIELIEVLKAADIEGLRAEDYDGPRWAERLESLKVSHDDNEEVRFDAALTVCIMRYLSDLHVGRVNPEHLGFAFDVSRKRLNLPQFVRQRLVDGPKVRSELAQVGPPFPGYQRLRDTLQHYIELAKRDSGEKLPGPIRIYPGEQYEGLPRLTSLLQLLGDLPDNVAVPSNSNTYEGLLVDAVKHFQMRHSLSPTGEVDPKTIHELNVPLSDRIEQMRLGLERYRWLPYQFKKPPIVVNLPEFRLYGFSEGGRVDLTMNVNVGNEYDFQTPMFEKNIQYIVFRPYWTPPPNILRNEIIPDLEDDPSLEEHNLELVSTSGQVIKSGHVTPAMLQQVRSGKLTVRQPPGPENSMGLVKFMFPNEHHVYIHDTPASIDMFTEGDRAFSHGCIHAKEPAKLAVWLLRNTPGWDRKRVDQAMHEGHDNVRVNLATPIPVLIVYETAVVDENGDVHFFHDIYGHDATLKEELAKGYPYSK